MLARLRAAQDASELTETQCVHLVSSVLIGGVDTNQAQLAYALRLFAEHPEQWDRLTRDPSLVPAAVDEVLRFEPIAPFMARLVAEELTVHDVVFPAGTVLFACALTANHDLEVLEEPNRFDISADRGDAKLLTFGAGLHFCPGAALARAELEEALGFLAERVTTFELAGPPRYDTPSGVYGLLELPLRFETATVGARP
nr:cytochrome P450 [Aquisalimonas sp.]